MASLMTLASASLATWLTDAWMGDPVLGLTIAIGTR